MTESLRGMLKDTIPCWYVAVLASDHTQISLVGIFHFS